MPQKQQNVHEFKAIIKTHTMRTINQTYSNSFVYAFMFMFYSLNKHARKHPKKIQNNAVG